MSKYLISAEIRVEVTASSEMNAQIKLVQATHFLSLDNGERPAAIQKETRGVKLRAIDFVCTTKEEE